jgi:uncharacterized protein YbjT (DUF2867 family)
MFSYFESKRAAERVVAKSGLPWTTLRATQFHESLLMLVQKMAKLPVIPVPAGWSFQPIDAGEVADQLVDLALGTPSGLAPEMAGPRAYEMAELVRIYLKASGKHRLILPAWTPGKAARAVRAGANLAPDQAVGRRTWEEFLALHVSGLHMSGKDNWVAPADDPAADDRGVHTDVHPVVLSGGPEDS